MPKEFSSIGTMIKENPYQSRKISIYKQNTSKCIINVCLFLSIDMSFECIRQEKDRSDTPQKSKH